MTGRLTCGVHHVGLTVPDLDEARAFFCDVLGFDVVGGAPDYPAVFVSDGDALITLWRAEDPSTARAFDRRANIGLHHLSLAVADEDALAAAWRKVSTHPGVTVDVAPQPTRPGSTTRHFLVFIPGGIRLEFATARK
ncbi:VOC family protein [Sphingomonas trueperi]|uniref:VOC family protein n=1 Tax=Sphingomonas trueperi TaxID=53317 RepID=UPI000EB1A28F